MHLTAAAAAAMLMAVVTPHAADALLIPRPDDFAIKLFNPTTNNIQSRPLRVLFNDETDRPIAPGFPLLITNTISTGVGTCAIITTDVGEPALEWTRPLEDLDFKGITTCL
jgi:hypothetical protein